MTTYDANGKMLSDNNFSGPPPIEPGTEAKRAVWDVAKETEVFQWCEVCRGWNPVTGGIRRSTRWIPGESKGEGHPGRRPRCWQCYRDEAPGYAELDRIEQARERYRLRAWAHSSPDCVSAYRAALDFIEANEWGNDIGSEYGRGSICLDCGAEEDQAHSEPCAWLGIMKRAGRR